jgi:hypothetical protein
MRVEQLGLVLGDGQINLQAPEQDETSEEAAQRSARQANPRQARQETATEQELERVNEEKRECTREQGKGEPVEVKSAPEFAVQEIMQSASGAAKDAGQSGNCSARSGEWKPLREGAWFDEGERGDRGEQEREVGDTPALLAWAEA